MKNDPVYNVHFIKIIQRYPQLYNKALAPYVDQREINRIWKEIADILKDTVSNCVMRWTTLRNLYNRLIERNYTDATAFRSSKFYYLAHSMKFLLPYMNPKDEDTTLDTKANLTNRGNRTQPKRVINQKKPMPTIGLENTNVGGDLSNLLGVKMPKKEFRKKSILTKPNAIQRRALLYPTRYGEDPYATLVGDKSDMKFSADDEFTDNKESESVRNNKESKDSNSFVKQDTQVTQNAVQKRKRQHAPDDRNNLYDKLTKLQPRPRKTDPDTAFFQSILPLVEKLTDRQKIRFRICAMQLLEYFSEKKVHHITPDVKSVSFTSGSNIQARPTPTKRTPPICSPCLVSYDRTDSSQFTPR